MTERKGTRRGKEKGKAPIKGKSINVKKRKDGTPETTVGISLEKNKGEFQLIGGSKSDDFNQTMAMQALRSSWLQKGETDPDSERVIQASLAALYCNEPKSELEGMLFAQMWAVHSASMEAYRRAMIPNQTHEGRVENLRSADRASRTYALLLETLNKHRGKGQQKVTVEHVHVHQGGQAIVGNVSQGGGGAEKSGEQPDAKQLTHAPVAPLPSQDAKRETVPVAESKRPKTVPYARRRTGKRRT